MYCIYTIAQNKTGGGGRRFYLEICKELNLIDDLYGSMSINYYDLKNIYPEYKFNHFSFESSWSENDNSNLIPQENFIISHLKKCDKLLFDTEYSYYDFQNRFKDLLKKHPIKTIVLVHDQFWKKDPYILKRLNLLRNKKEIINFDPYLKLNIGLKRDRLNEFFFFFKSNLLPIRSFFKRSQTDKLVKWRIKELKKVDYIFSLTDRSANSTAKLLKHKKSFSNFALETNTISSNNLKKNDDFRIITYSRIAAEKNIEISILAFSKANIPNKKLIIMGLKFDNNYFNQLMKLIKKLNLINKVEFKINVTEDEAISNLLNSNAFICSDICDFNLSTYKALSLGVPVVVSAGYDFNKDIFKNNFIISNNYNSTEMAKSLEKVSQTEIKQSYFNSEKYSFKNYITKLNFLTND